MTIHRVSSVGLDINIHHFNDYIHSKVTKHFKMSDTYTNDKYKAYARVNKTQTKDGFIPEFFENGEYKEVLLNDRLDILSFFDIGDKIIYKELNEVPASFVVFVNLKNIYNTLDDEKFRTLFQSIFETNKFGFSFTGFEIGINNVLKEYSGWRKSEGMKYRDIYPYHMLRCNFTLRYRQDSCAC